MTQESATEPVASALSPAFRAPLLDPAVWQDGLYKFSLAANLGVALVDAEGRSLTLRNPQPLWSLFRKQKPASPGGCPFALAPVRPCTCVARALETGRWAVADDRTGLVHFAVPLVLGEERLGALLAGQVFTTYPEQFAVEHVAELFGIPPGRAWQQARLEHPVKRATLEVYADLLATLGQTLLQTRYHSLMEADRLAEMTRLRDQAVTEMAERERAEAALRESEERYRVLYAALPVAAFVCDRNAVIQNYNPRAVKLWGREPKVGVEQHCGSVKLWLPDGTLLPHAHSPMMEVLHTGTPCRNVEVSIERPDGSRVPVIVNFCALKDAQGEVAGVVTSFDDITERKLAEEAKAKLAAIVESSDDAIVGKDLNGVITSWNRGAERLFGYTAQEAIGQPITMLIPPDRHDEEPGILERIRHGESIEHYETVRRHKDGALLDISLTVSPLRDARGQIVGASRIARNITESKRTEDELRASFARFRFMAESMPQKFFTAKPSGEVDYFNRQWMEYTGLTFEQIRDWGWTQLIHPDDVDENLRVWRHSIETGEYFQLEHRFRRADGEYRWHLTRAQAMRDVDGEVLMWIGSNTDIDDVKRTEEGLKNADRRKNEFLALLAHELRNPLAPISNAVQVLRLADGDQEAIQAAAEMMGRQVGQMVRLVDDLLDVSRISRGKIELRRGRIELASAVHHAVEAARPSVHCMDHELTVTLPPQPVYLNADPTRLAQIVGNLLNNACNFTDKGGHIWLTAEREGGQAVIRVRDSGIGIAADQLSRVFDMFTQLDTSLERPVGGLGIGLTLVKNLVELHDGTVEVQSAGIGQGSEFTVRLPILVDTTKPPTPEPPARPPTPVTGRRILVVDDNHDSAESLAILLKGTGNETHTAYDGREALEAAATFRPDVVILDIGLPKLNGYEAARQIREQPWGKDMMLVAATGWDQDEDRQKSKDAGFNGHLVKPVEYAALEKLLATLPSCPTARWASLGDDRPDECRLNVNPPSAFGHPASATTRLPSPGCQR